MKFETYFLDLVSVNLYNLLTDAKRELCLRWADNMLESPFMRTYKDYQLQTVRRTEETLLAHDPYALDAEISGNFLSADHAQKSNYVQLLQHKITHVKSEVSCISV